MTNYLLDVVTESPFFTTSIKKRYMGGIVWAPDEASTYATFVGYHPLCRTCQFNDDAMYVVNTNKYYALVSNNLDGTYGTRDP